MSNDDKRLQNPLYMWELILKYELRFTEGHRELPPIHLCGYDEEDCLKIARELGYKTIHQILPLYEICYASSEDETPHTIRLGGRDKDHAIDNFNYVYNGLGYTVISIVRVSTDM